MSAPRLPSFVIVGAVKAATTWTGNQLRAQPSLFLPTAEPHYFSSRFDRGPVWYASLFAGASEDQIVGEKSADYLAHPEAARRLTAILPAARIIVQLRSPVERAYSDYCMLYRRGTVDGRIERHLTGSSRESRFLDGGLYRQHLDRFFDRFDREQIQVVLYEDIQRVPATVLEAVRSHIGLSAPVAAVAPAHRHNDSRAPMLPIGMRRALAPLKGAVAPLRRHDWFKGLHRRLARKVDYPALTTDLRRRLRDYYAADVEALQTVLGRNLDHWLAAEPPTESA